jgi:RNA polymerase sigma-70 factor (ECF subfamily)
MGSLVSALERLNASAPPLIARARRGDTAAFTELVRSCRSLIYRWSVVATGDPDDGEDVTQEVLVRLHSHLGRYRTGSRFTNWLYRVTRNAATDRLRTRTRQRRLRDESRAMYTAATGNSPEARVIHDETDRIVRSFLEALPARQRQALDLIDIQGHSPAEAAAMLGLGAGTVRTHLHRARRTLRTRLLVQHPELLEGLRT